MMSLFFSQIKSIFLKDLLIEYSYKLRFSYTIIFIFLQLMIFYFLSSFLDKTFQRDPASDVANIFGFFLTGICLLDVSYTLISHVAIKIEEYKKIGVFEEIFALPIEPVHFIIFSNIYPLLFSILKIFIYLIFGFIFFDLSIASLQEMYIIFFTFLISLFTFIGISLIACSFSILFYRGLFVSMIHNTLSILIGGVFYPVSIILNFNFIEWFLPIVAVLELIRFSTDVLILDTGDVFRNFIIITTHAFCFFSIGLVILKISLNKAFKEGRISLY